MLIDSAAEFLPLLPDKSRLLCLDVGEKTIGLALSDVMRCIASPLETIERKKFQKDMDYLQGVTRKYAIGGLVIGYPVNMDGSHGPRTQSVRTFVSTMSKQITLPMLLWDERLSTMAVERVMLEA